MRQAYRRRPWRVPNPGVNDEELNGGSSSTSRPPRLPGAAAVSSTRVGFLFGARRRPLRAHQGRQVCLFGERQPPLLRDCHGRGQDPLHPACLGAAMDCSRLCIRRRSSGQGRAAVAAPGRGRGAGGRPPPSFGRPAAERAWRPGASPPGRAQRSRGAPRCASGAALGFRRPACSPLAVVASELTLGAMAYEGRGRGGRAVTQGGVGSAARRPSSKPG